MEPLSLHTVQKLLLSIATVISSAKLLSVSLELFTQCVLKLPSWNQARSAKNRILASSLNPPWESFREEDELRFQHTTLLRDQLMCTWERLCQKDHCTLWNTFVVSSSSVTQSVSARSDPPPGFPTAGNGTPWSSGCPSRRQPRGRQRWGQDPGARKGGRLMC